MDTDMDKELITIMNKFHKLKLMNSLENLSHAEYFMLSMIDSCCNNQPEESNPGRLTVSGLAARLNMTKAGASKMSSILEEKNYLRRVSDQSDKRITYIELTDTGQEVLQKTRDTMKELSNRIWSQMGTGDMEQLIGLFKKLYKIIEKETEIWKRG